MSGMDFGIRVAYPNGVIDQISFGDRVAAESAEYDWARDVPDAEVTLVCREFGPWLPVSVPGGEEPNP